MSAIEGLDGKKDEEDEEGEKATSNTEVTSWQSISQARCARAVTPPRLSPPVKVVTTEFVSYHHLAQHRKVCEGVQHAGEVQEQVKVAQLESKLAQVCGGSKSSPSCRREPPRAKGECASVPSCAGPASLSDLLDVQPDTGAPVPICELCVLIGTVGRFTIAEQEKQKVTRVDEEVVVDLAALGDYSRQIPSRIIFTFCVSFRSTRTSWTVPAEAQVMNKHQKVKRTSCMTPQVHKNTTTEILT
eukprot:747120-Hanusia_phi.AAC.2